LFCACEAGNLDEVKKIIEENKAAGDEWNMVEIRQETN
jgi:hypothetical protein